LALSHEYVLSGEAFTSQRRGQQTSRSAKYVVDVKNERVRVEFGKKLTFEGIKKYAHCLQSDPLFRSNYSEIADLTDVEELDLEADEFLKLADEIDPFSANAKRAFVVRNSIQNHAARMHKVLRPLRNIEIFHSIEEAECWIMTQPDADPCLPTEFPKGRSKPGCRTSALRHS
jgi:hypothetical protein